MSHRARDVRLAPSPTQLMTPELLTRLPHVPITSCFPGQQEGEFEPSEMGFMPVVMLSRIRFSPRQRELIPGHALCMVLSSEDIW